MKRFLLYLVFTLVFVSAASAQNDCELMYESAKIYFENKEYKKAADMFGLVVNECGENYGGAGLKIKECKKLLDANKRSSVSTISETHSSIHVTPPSHYSLKETEASKTAYMSINGVDFYSINEKGEILDQIGSDTYVTDIKNLDYAIDYDGLIDSKKQVTILYKLIRPDGEVIYSDQPPYGYTSSEKFWVQPEPNSYYKFKNYYKGDLFGGIYTFELWYENSLLYRTSFELKEQETLLSKGTWKTRLKKCLLCATQSDMNGGRDRYKGQVTEHNQRNGIGILAWTSIDNYYIGEWQYDNMIGKGIHIILQQKKQITNCKNAKYYVGDFSFGEKKDGYGRCYDKLGNMLYNGRFVNNKPTDTYPMTNNNKFDSYKFECIEYSNGDCYVGETIYGRRNGMGFYMWSNGDLWYGSWSNNNRDNDGVFMKYNDPTVSTGKYGIVK